MLSQAAGSIPSRHGVRIDPAYGSKNVYSVPGHEAKSLTGIPPSFYQEGVHSNKTSTVLNLKHVP